MSALNSFRFSDSPPSLRRGLEDTPAPGRTPVPETPDQTPTRSGRSNSTPSTGWSCPAEQARRDRGEEDIFSEPRQALDMTPRTTKKRKLYARNVCRTLGLNDSA